MKKGGIPMRDAIDISSTVPEIVAVLHRHQIPIDCIDQVFRVVMQDIRHNTIPYNPNLDKTMDLAISEMTDTVTEPRG